MGFKDLEQKTRDYQMLAGSKGKQQRDQKNEPLEDQKLAQE